MVAPLGTLIVVVLKARNLPNKQRIGKQDPYATCTYLSHRKRTKTDKRGGQHPVWDDELRFDIYEHAKDAMASAAVSTTATGGVAPVKTAHPPIGAAGSAGVRDLRVAVYADDPRDPDLIGEGNVDLTDTLKKGEFDDWVTINNKGKYQGEVYLEMTFYSAKPPPEKLMTPTGPARAGVFEASSPHSVLRTAQQQPARAGARNGTHSPSPAVTPSKKAEAWSVPPALRTGAPASHPRPRPSMGALPLPGEPASVQHPAISSRQRSTGSLSMPTADHPAHLAGSPSPSPSRNHHPYDRPAPLVTALDALSISTKPNPHAQHSSHGSPAELHAPYHPSHGRPHRHSFSGHPHLPPPNLLQHPHSASPPIHDPPEPPDTRYQHPYPDHYPPPSQPAQRVPITPRRPLPIPGGDSINRPTSAWGDYPPPPHGAHSYSHDALAGSQQPPAGYGAHPHSGELERPLSRVSVPQTNPAGYLPPMQYGDGAGPSTGLPSQHGHSAYAEPPRHYQTPAPFVAGHSHSQSHGQHGAHFALPPPPAGQAPVPIHEVFGRSVPASAPPLGPYASYAGFPSAGGEQGGYEVVYEGGAHEGSFQTFQEQPYTVANAPPPPPPHLQQQLQYLPPAPVGGQMYYHQQGYAGAVPPPGPPRPGGGNGNAGGGYGAGEYGTYQHGQNQVGNGYAPRTSIGMAGQPPPPLPPPPPLQQQQHQHHPHHPYQHHQQQEQQHMGYPVAYRTSAQVVYPQTLS